MKKLIIILAAVLLIPLPALADGGVVAPDYGPLILLPEQKAVIVWEDGRENLTLSTKITPEKITDMAWIIPIQSKSKPIVEEGNISLFYDLSRLFRSNRGGFGWMGSAEAMGAAQVEVVEVKMIDMYYVIILKATDSSSLLEWLNVRGFEMPEGSETILEDYIEDYYFVINRINLPNKLDSPLTEEDYECAKDIETPRYFHNLKELEENINHYFYTLDSCGNASYKTVKLMKETELGISTPLMISFEPEKPYYPMKISSINEGNVRIDVYFLSDFVVLDESGLLDRIDEEQFPDHLKEKYNVDKDYVTQLRYEGSLKNLDKDSFFRERNLLDFIGGFFKNILASFSIFK